jgi:hypothetical protein
MVVPIWGLRGISAVRGIGCGQRDLQLQWSWITHGIRPLEDVLALPLYTSTMGEKPLKERDIEGTPNCGREGLDVILHGK